MSQGVNDFLNLEESASPLLITYLDGCGKDFFESHRTHHCKLWKDDKIREMYLPSYFKTNLG